MRNRGFTLIEIVVIIVILGILAVIALPKFINLQDDANQVAMRTMKGAIASADKLIALKISLNPDMLNNDQTLFTLDNGQNIRVKGQLADGRWDITFLHLLDFNDIAMITSNNCDNTSLKWCVRQRSANWFLGRGYATLGTGRGFVIFPFNKNVNEDRCYIYFLNQNDSEIPVTVQPSIIGSDFSEC
ncbi:prepilin-type N-terminal cleavage/methylation domain-containing protein [Shewanella frigidimarina]|uniref:prepilin-type N-terminal cleavage/methylation domain-containing protein n=1 Tax=Shewanella frigidimarina TaxID=56812 RepID=UPI003D79F3A8